MLSVLRYLHIADLTPNHLSGKLFHMTDTTTLQQQARLAIANADFRQCWPVDVRQNLVRAAMTEGELPPYAVRTVERALRVAAAIEKRLGRDIEVGEANLTHAQRKARAGAAA
jgi:hypothetical protein